MGLGLSQYLPLVVYIGCCIMCLVALTGRPIWTLYYLMPLLPYRTLRDRLGEFPLGGNMLTVLVLATVIGGLIKGGSLPKSKLYTIWLIFGVYLYLSMWLGALLGNGPIPLWLSDQNFVTWKDYMLMPLLLVATGLVVKSRSEVRMVIIITAVSLLLIDRSSILESMSRSFAHFDESKRDAGPLGFAGSNGLAAFLSQFTMFFWGFAQYVRNKKHRLICYGIVATSLFATMYTFSRASYIAVVAGAALLGIFKNRKLLIVVFVFLLTWQTVVPSAVTERVTMTQDSNGRLEASAAERVKLWEAARDSFISSPIFGTGFATFQFGSHVDGLRDTHNWYVKVLTETGLIGAAIALAMLLQMIKVAYGLFRHGEGPLYQGLGFGLLLACAATFILNLFGDRWTYVEINGLLWILIGAAIRVSNMPDSETETDLASTPVLASPNPYLVYR